MTTERYHSGNRVGRPQISKSRAEEILAGTKYDAARPSKSGIQTESLLTCSICTKAIYCIHPSKWSAEMIRDKINTMHQVREDGSCNFKPFESIEVV